MLTIFSICQRICLRSARMTERSSERRVLLGGTLRTGRWIRVQTLYILPKMCVHGEYTVQGDRIGCRTPHGIHMFIRARLLLRVVCVSEVTYICIACLRFTYHCVCHINRVMCFEPSGFHARRVTIWECFRIA